jgi:hypothetical protein
LPHCPMDTKRTFKVSKAPLPADEPHRSVFKA